MPAHDCRFAHFRESVGINQAWAGNSQMVSGNFKSAKMRRCSGLRGVIQSVGSLIFPSVKGFYNNTI